MDQFQSKCINLIFLAGLKILFNPAWYGETGLNDRTVFHLTPVAKSKVSSKKLLKLVCQMVNKTENAFQCMNASLAQTYKRSFTK